MHFLCSVYKIQVMGMRGVFKTLLCTPEIKIFAKIFNGFESLTNFEKMLDRILNPSLETLKECV